MQQPLTAEHPNAIAVRQAEVAAGQGNIDALRLVHAEDMVVHNSPFNGDAVGREALYQQNTVMFDKTAGSLKLEPYHVIANDNTVLVTGKVTAQRLGQTLDQVVLEVWRMEQGQCVEVWDYFSNQQAWDKFWQ